MTLKIIGAGFGRTGTLSLKSALETLGFVKTHHMLEVLPNGKQVQHWYDIGNGETPNWDAVFEGYQACVDFPASTYYNELMAHYPDAKVILTVRDVDRWYESTRNTIYRFGTIIPKWARVLFPRVRKTYQMSENTVWTRVFKDRFEDEAFAKSVFLDYIEQVKRDVPDEKLLIFEVKQGWQPLCEFLGIPQPEGPFPHVNDTASMRRSQTIMQIVFAAIPIAVLIVILSGIFMVLR